MDGMYRFYFAFLYSSKGGRSNSRFSLSPFLIPSFLPHLSFLPSGCFIKNMYYL